VPLSGRNRRFSENPVTYLTILVLRTKSIVGTVVQYAVATGIFTSALALGSIVAVGFLFTWTASFISAYAIVSIS